MVNDGIGNGNFTTLKPFAFWTQHVLPLVYGDEISYMETLGKMRDILNELIKNNNNLPEYIQQMIEEYISSGAIEEVIDKILSNFILNVKYPPTGIPKAKGDGTTNDHDSIQGCIDYAAGLGGGVVYLPAGKYLTSSLVLKPGVTLLGFGRYATSLILAGGATAHLITGTVSDAGLLNLTLNAKMSSQVNIVDAVELVGNHIDIRNCIVKDCYTSINVQKTGSAINICDVICEVASDACLRIGGTDGGLLVDGLEMTGLSTNLGVAYIVTDSNGDIYRNINIHGTGAIGIDVSGSGNYFDGKIFGVAKDYEDISGDNTFNLFGKTRVENLTGDMVENANAFSQVAVNGIERQGANISDNASNSITLNANDVILNPTNALTYKTPYALNREFNAVKFKDSVGTNYDVLVNNPNYISDAINPDDFEGANDNEKLQNCFNSLSLSGGNIVIGRKYNITAPVTLTHNTDGTNNKIIVYGVGNAELHFNGGYFVGAATLANGGYDWVNLRFTGVKNNTIFAAPGQYLIRMNFINCVIKDFDCIINTPENDYVQSWYFSLCWVRHVGYMIVCKVLHNITLNQCLVEAESGVIQKTGNTYGENLCITDCCIEGMTTNYPIVINGILNLKITGCYFEINKGDIYFNNGIGCYMFTIADNFSGAPAEAMITLPDNATPIFTGTIERNTVTTEDHQTEALVVTYAAGATTSLVYENLYIRDNFGLINNKFNVLCTNNGEITMDWNNAIVTGIYQALDKAYLNIPATESTAIGIVNVYYCNATHAWQSFTDFRNSKLWYRYKLGKTWSGWYSINPA